MWTLGFIGGDTFSFWMKKEFQAVYIKDQLQRKKTKILDVLSS